MLSNIISNSSLGNRRPKRYSSTPLISHALHNHQKSVREHMKTHKRLLVVHGTGSGKTLSAAYIAKDYLEEVNNRFVIFVTPKAVQNQFINSVTTVLANNSGYYFTTYDNLTLFLDERHMNRRESFKNLMARTMIIADEAHYITDKTKKAKVFYDIFKHANKVVLMTGTPIINGQLSDLLPYAKILNPSQTLTAKDMVSFEKYFKCKISIYEVPKNSKNFPKLFSTVRFKFPLTNNQLATVNENRFKKYAGPGTWAFNRSLYAWRAFGNKDEPKFRKFLEIFKKRPYKTIVFFKEYVTLDSFANFLKRHNIFFRKVTGKDPRKNLIISRDKPRSRVVYLLTSAAKEGLDFKGVRTVIFMDFPWVPSDYNQIVGRARRFKSHANLNALNRTVQVYELAYSHPSKTTLNVRSLNILTTKRELIKNILQRLSSVSIEKQDCTGNNRTVIPLHTRAPAAASRAQVRSVLPQRQPHPGNMGLARLFRTPIRRKPTTPGRQTPSYLVERGNLSAMFGGGTPRRQRTGANANANANARARSAARVSAALRRSAVARSAAIRSARSRSAAHP